MSLDWTQELHEQLDLHWRSQLRPGLDGLTDEEYFWEPVPGAWNVRRRGTSTARMATGAGDLTIDFDHPEPVPAPVTTIAWRLGHLIVGVLGARVANHFGGPPTGYETFTYAATADGALAQLDTAYAAWSAGVTALDEAALERACGPAEGHYATEPISTLILHINREVIHHGAEILLLRDLHRHR